MAAPRRFDLEDIINRPGTYFNPETEVLLVVDDAPELDADLFEDEAEGVDWVLLGDDVPLDERARDEVIERFEVRHHPGATSAPRRDDEEEEEEELEPDEELPELYRRVREVAFGWGFTKGLIEGGRARRECRGSHHAAANRGV